jgi:hypothetical protein
VESILRPHEERDSEELVDLRRTSTELREVCTVMMVMVMTVMMIIM